MTLDIPAIKQTLEPVAAPAAVVVGLVFSLVGIRIWPWFVRAVGIAAGGALGYGLGWLAVETALATERPFEPEQAMYVVWGPAAVLALVSAFVAVQTWRFLIFSAGACLGGVLGGALAGPIGLAEYTRWVSLAVGLVAGIAFLKAERGITIAGTALGGAALAGWGTRELAAGPIGKPVSDAWLLGGFGVFAALGMFVQWKAGKKDAGER